MIGSAKRGQIVQSTRFNAPLFRSLVNDLSTDERRVILDLGAARKQTVELFSKYRCRLDIADLADELNNLNALTEPQQILDAAEELLPKCNIDSTDLVLCWDIMNYLDRPALRALMSCIAVRGKRGARVHALIFYSHTHMPAQPGHYVPTEDYGLVDIATPYEERPAPRYSPDDLQQCLVDFSIERAMLLSNGMQEFLFRLR